jgi:hypothetical protein
MNSRARWAKRTVWLTLAAVLTIGCNPITLPFLIFRPEPKAPAEYPLRPKEGDLSDKDKELKVLLLCHHNTGVAYEFAGSDRELASMLAKRLSALATEAEDKITVIPPAQVDKFKMSNPNWRYLHATAIGKQLEADYVLQVHVGNVNVYQPNSAKQIYEGRAEVAVDVYAVPDGVAEPKHRYVLPYTYPKTGMIASSDVPPSRFKQLFLERLALELARKHVEYKEGDGILSER